MNPHREQLLSFFWSIPISPYSRLFFDHLRMLLGQRILLSRGWEKNFETIYPPESCTYFLPNGPREPDIHRFFYIPISRGVILYHLPKGAISSFLAHGHSSFYKVAGDSSVLFFNRWKFMKQTSANQNAAMEA